MPYWICVALRYNQLRRKKITKLYKGICETTFKKRFASPKMSFNVKTYKNETKLSPEYWVLKNNQLNPKVSWQIKGRYKSHNWVSGRCKLCLNKKLEISDDPGRKLLNKRSEVISHCRHQNKLKLKTLKHHHQNIAYKLLVKVPLLPQYQKHKK